MSVLTLAQIKSEVRVILGGRTDIDPRLNDMVNLSQLRLARLHDFDELRSTATIDTVVTASPATDKLISLTSLGRYRKIYSIRLFASTQRSRKLKKILPKNWDKRIPEPEYYSRGCPEAYTLWGKDQMELWRVPDIIYTMHFRYSRWPTLVTDANDGDNLDLENIDDLVIHLTGSYAALTLGNQEKSNELFSIYRTLSREAIGEDDEDFERNLAGNSDGLSSTSLGYNDPFVRSVETNQVESMDIAFAVWSAVVALIGAAIVWELSRMRGELKEIKEQFVAYMLATERRVTRMETIRDIHPNG